MRITPWAGLVPLAVAMLGCDPSTPVQPSSSSVALDRHRAPTVTTYATGLDNPRGLRFGPDGALYVAEGGSGGTNSTAGQCDQVIPPVGPYLGGSTGRISRIDRHGVRTTVADHLPSSQTAPTLGTLVSGVADVEFIGHTLYGLLAGAGCSHGVPDVPNGVIRVDRDGSWKLIADLSAFQQAHPVANPEPDDFEPDGTWYSMVAVRGALYAVEPNHGEVDRITPEGRISRVVDVSAVEGHVVPTAIAYHGDFFVGNLSTFPLVPGSARIFQITPSGRIPRVFGRLTSVLGVAFDRRGQLYALENTVCPTDDPCMPTPFTGQVVRVSRDGTVETVVGGLMLPTGMTIGPDGAIYVSVFGFGTPAGAGAVMRIALE